jgi:hypothetical protein
MKSDELLFLVRVGRDKPTEIIPVPQVRDAIIKAVKSLYETKNVRAVVDVHAYSLEEDYGSKLA